VQELTQDRGAAPVLAFSTPLLLVGGGSVDVGLLQALAQRGMAVVGVDSGADTVRAAGIMPDAIVGDLDSLADPTSWPASVPVLGVAEQQSIDFEKALYATSAPVTLALGMTGGRFDHTLAALDAIIRHAHGRAIIVVDEADVALAVSGDVKFAPGQGARVSVHPLQPVRFARSQGLRWALDGLTLAAGVRTGTSNLATSDVIAIEPGPGEAGLYLLILGREHLDGLIALALARAGAAPGP